MVEVKPTEPVSSQEVYQALCGSSSQDPAIVQTSSKLLKEYQDRPGTYDYIHTIAAERNDVPLDLRRMAIIQFKNGALTVWKNRRLFNDEIRGRIRARSMSFLYEEDNIIAECNAMIVAKISRADFPFQWPSLLSDLTSIIQTQVQLFLSNPSGADPTNTRLLKRTLRVLDQVVKEFCAMKMPGGIKTMAQIAESLYSPLTSHYDWLSTLLQRLLTEKAPLDPHLHYTCQEVVQLCHLVFKLCSRIMVWSWHKAGQPQYRTILEALSSFLQSSFQLVPVLSGLRKQLILTLRQAIESSTTSASSTSSAAATVTVQASQTLHQLTKHLRLYGKMFRRMQQLSSSRFVTLPHANDLVLFYWQEVVQATSDLPDLISDTYDALYPTRILVQGMVLFRESLNVWSGKGDTQNMTVLSQQSVEEAVKLLLTRLLPLTPTDLEKWMIDPEEWVNEEEKEGDAWEYELRPCGERVLVTLCTHYHVFVIPLLLRTFQAVLASPGDNLSSILQREAVYCAIGRCANRLHGKLDFDGWLQKHLISEAQDANPDYRIIKRRIAWVIGKWHADHTTSRIHPLAWEVLRHLMQDRGSGSDPVVRLSAADALRECVDTVDFDLQSFQPFLGDFITSLLQIIAESDTLESKNRLIKTLTTVIECVRKLIMPFSKLIIDPIPELWQSAAEAFLLKASLIVMVKCLVEATREHSSEFVHVVMALVQETLSPKVKIQLDEDGLHLWKAALQNALTLESPGGGAPGYIDMFSQVLPLLSGDLDLLGTIITIVESYLILDANRVLSLHALDLFRALESALSKSVNLNIKDVVKVINLTIQQAPAALWAEPMHSSGLFAALAKAVIEDKHAPWLLTEHIYVFARIGLSDPLILNQLVMGAAPALNMPETQVFEGLLDQWWAKFDCMSEPHRRKLVAMGIACWVSTARPEVLGRLYTEIFNLWLDVFGELKEALADESTGDMRSPLTLFWRNSTEHFPDFLADFPDYDENTPEADRRRQIYLRDPVVTQKLTVFVKEKLQQAEATCGTQFFHANYLEKADSAVLNQIKAELLTGN